MNGKMRVSCSETSQKERGRNRLHIVASLALSEALVACFPSVPAKSWRDTDPSL